MSKGAKNKENSGGTFHQDITRTYKHWHETETEIEDIIKGYFVVRTPRETRKPQRGSTTAEEKKG
jgi:hypothetical protein